VLIAGDFYNIRAGIYWCRLTFPILYKLAIQGIKLIIKVMNRQIKTSYEKGRTNELEKKTTILHNGRITANLIT